MAGDASLPGRHMNAAENSADKGIVNGHLGRPLLSRLQRLLYWERWAESPASPGNDWVAKMQPISADLVLSCRTGEDVSHAATPGKQGVW
jgi:hypothetical protein